MTEGTTVRLSVLAKPRAKRSAVLRAEGLTVDVAVAAPPVDGAANEELVRVIAEALEVPKRRVRVVVGASGKRKMLDVDGLPAEIVTERLAASVRR
ncbi:MAG: DUF167 domain-containing protein [Polyangiaceae bacterium]